MTEIEPDSEQESPPERSPDALNQEERELASNLERQAELAARGLKAAQFERIAQWARISKDHAAISSLDIILAPPTAWSSYRRRYNRPEWTSARRTAISALEAIGSPKAFELLTRTVLLDNEKLSEEAALALERSGSKIVGPAIQSIHRGTDWTLSGMIRIIHAFRNIGDKEAGPFLARVLFGLMPSSPSRWTRWQIRWGMVLGGVMTLVIGMESLYDIGVHWLEVILSGILTFAFLSGGSAIALTVVTHYRKGLEANDLNDAAAGALINIADIRSIPSLIEVSNEKYSNSARAASTSALKRLLPLIGPNDMGLLDGPAERRLTAMFATYDYVLMLAALKALGHAGTGQSLGPVERLARRRPAIDDNGFAEVRLEAERVLPILAERKRLEEASSILLRPSQAAQSKGDMLLRPASSLEAYSEPEQLLRPGSSD